MRRPLHAVALIAEVPSVLIVRKDMPFNDLKEFVEYAKKNQDKWAMARPERVRHPSRLRRAGTAIGRPHHPCPVRGTGPAMTDLPAGRIDYICGILATAKPQINGGTVKAIAFDEQTRSPVLPNVPTTVEPGVPTSKPIPGTRSSCPRARRRPSSRS